MTRIRLSRPVLLVLALGVAACSENPVYNDWNREVGASIDEGGFGNATMNNIQRQNGEKPYIEDLNKRFSREVPTAVNFAFNSAELDPLAHQILLQQAAFIRKFPEARFRVYGHTDAVGSAAYNKRLGLRRAQAVVNFLVSHGISRSRLEAMVSFGESQPLVITSDQERRNRRTVTEVSGFVSTHPMVLDGKYAAIVYRTYASGGTGGEVGEGGGAIPGMPQNPAE